MTTRIGLISDVHSSPDPLAEALELFNDEKVDDIICCGDIAGYYDTLEPTIDLLVRSNCKAIIGNHDQSYLEKTEQDGESTIRSYLQALPQTLDLEIEGKRVHVVHANPPSEQHGGIKLLDQQGEIRQDRIDEWTVTLSEFEQDVLIVGHTHQVFAEQLGPVLAINPGSSVYNHSCMILNLPEMTVDIFGLSGQKPLKLWNWGMLVRPPPQDN